MEKEYKITREEYEVLKILKKRIHVKNIYLDPKDKEPTWQRIGIDLIATNMFNKTRKREFKKLVKWLNDGKEE